VSGAVLVVSESAESAAALGAMLGSDHWTIHQARSCDEAVARLVRDRVSVVVCEPRLPDRNWRDMLRYTSHAPNGPALIVTSNPGDEALWAEVLDLGGYDVLAQRFDQSEVARVITSAGRTR
jgi:DNA-binding NtrC family response regulator